MFVSEGSERVKTATLSFKLDYYGVQVTPIQDVTPVPLPTLLDDSDDSRQFRRLGHRRAIKAV